MFCVCKTSGSTYRGFKQALDVFESELLFMLWDL